MHFHQRKEIAMSDCTARNRKHSNRWLLEALEARTLLTGSPYEDRGWISIIVDNTVATSISDNLAQLVQDEIGDGETGVSVHTDAPRMDDENYVWSNSQGIPI